MKLEIGKLYHGFKILKCEHVEEVNADCYLCRHEKSGARLLYLDCDDDNKVFSIGFRTPPFDDSGVAHILEHSSLCGSRKYRLKEPFVELAKGSMNTFLNAMTYPDKTVYPVASRNAKDFFNLMDVYLDAVFYPLIYENPYTLKQEGWHYEIDSIDAPLKYNGVVYNEMKGAYSSAEAYLDKEAMLALFPDTPYRYESGGYPDAIPNLSQEKFLKFHKDHYSPENSYIYLYGDVDIDKALKHISEEYLNNISGGANVNTAMPVQEAYGRTKEVTAYYPVDKDSDTKAKVYHELSIVTGKRTDYQTVLALQMLEAVLLVAESGPLRRALIEAGVGQNISSSFESSLLQPVFSIKVSGSEEKYKDKFLSVIYKELQKITAEGLDRKLLEAALNAMEFKLRENDFAFYPKGLIFGLSVMDCWIYDGDPIDALRMNDKLITLRNNLKTRYYEELIETYLLDNTHKVLLTLLPKPGMEEEHVVKEETKMAQIKAKLSSHEVESLVKECAELHRRQNTPDDPENLATIPVLKRSDITREAEKVISELSEKDGAKLVYVPMNTNGIVYLNWEFDISGIDQKTLPYLTLFSDLFAKLDTKRYSYKELATEIAMYTGGISGNDNALPVYGNSEKYTIHFSVKAKTLKNNLEKTFDILQALLLETKHDDVKRFKEIVDEIKTGMDNNFFNRGMQLAISRLESYCSATGRVNELGEYSYYKFIQDLQANFADKAEKVLEIMRTLACECYNKTAYLFAYACPEEDKEKVSKMAEIFTDKLYNSSYAGKIVKPLDVSETNEAITTPGKVQYVVAGGNYYKHGFKNTGSMRVLSTILAFEYLWTKVRVQGGAYGSSGRFTNGVMVLSSYRDPQLAQTLAVYRDLPDWLRKTNFTDRELDKYVIGTISGMDVPLSNSLQMIRAVGRYLTDFDEKDFQRIRNEVLDVTNDDLHKLADVVETVLKDGLVCVVGGKKAIEENRKIFNKIING